jgi:ABC-type antimicrobial peptide transport system permease subunit
MLFAVRPNPGQVLTAADFERQFKTRAVKTDRVIVSATADGFDSGIVEHTFRARLFSGFGLIALMLAVVGVYAVQSFQVTTRRSEFGVRISLGATSRDISRLLIRETFRPALVGVVTGLLVAYWAAQFAQAFLYRVDARDPWTFAAVGSGLVVVALAAIWLPARRAAQTNPAVALRSQ